MHPENPISAFDTLIQKEGAFYAFRLPGDKDVTLGTGKVMAARNFDYRVEAFVIAPFNPSEKVSVIIPDILLRTPVGISDFNYPTKVITSETPAKRYKETIEQLLKILKQRHGKTVIARTIDVKANINSVGALFHTLCRRYPDLYVYCWCLESAKIWIGVVPEVLLKATGNKIACMSLAGTLASDSPEQWDEKNVQEQSIVTDFIEEIFRIKKIPYDKEGPKDLIAGPVRHLCTYINGIIKSPDFDILNFASLLSPTPAVCGYPRETALAEINRMENIERKYYGGFSGPIVNRRNASLFVTLRCMEIDLNQGRMRLYVGGGITEHSLPETEWKETEMKASTLLSVLNKK